jgi:TetR/AcrR family transcriptional regulator, regulator of cefoperazone and chloramphenicol sensitivity
MRPAPDDLTARATIRAAAIPVFADHGMAVVTITQIAAHAGVSPALVIHHFGSKDGLKEASDERALAVLEGMVTDLAGADCAVVLDTYSNGIFAAGPEASAPARTRSPAAGDAQ